MHFFSVALLPECETTGLHSCRHRFVTQSKIFRHVPHDRTVCEVADADVHTQRWHVDRAGCISIAHRFSGSATLSRTTYPHSRAHYPPNRELTGDDSTIFSVRKDVRISAYTMHYRCEFHHSVTRRFEVRQMCVAMVSRLHDDGSEETSFLLNA